MEARQQRTVIWDEQDKTPTLNDWLGKIEAGDEIQVLPKAGHPGWVNYVHEVEIKVFYSWETAGK